ncbi:MAG: hypothetical protein M9920_13645 [Verrucomicrobiae bacterium]|nr:hypothetical protein [Verrucomicrobiae bacterium]
MSKSKLIASIILILGLGGLSLYMNKDRFRRESIQITHRLNPARARDGRIPITFILNGYYKLKNIRVVNATTYETNKFVLPVWRLITESNSVPVSTFNYGNNIRGMHPDTKGARPETLEAGVTYRLMLETDQKQKAEYDFTVSATQ